MKKINYIAVMALAAVVMVGCGKSGKTEKAETPATDTAEVKADEGEVDEVNVDEVDVPEADVPEAEVAEPEIKKRNIGSLNGFFKADSRDEAYLVGKIDNKYAVHMSLWWYVGHNYEYDDATGEQEVAYLYTLYGAYYYDSSKNGLKNYLELSEDLIEPSLLCLPMLRSAQVRLMMACMRKMSVWVP